MNPRISTLKEDVPPWFLVGAVLLLLPLFGYMTYENINRQKIQYTRLLLEKSAALIRSFEAGTRSGMMGMHWKRNSLQNLLTETAMQPDIDYLLVTDVNGTILAHNDESLIGRKYGTDLDLQEISKSKTLRWRMKTDAGGHSIFEVYRKFLPTGGGWGGRRMQDMPGHMADWRMQHMVHFERSVIFVGLDIRSLESARKADMLHTLIMGATLLLIGFSGVILLFLTQRYRAAKTSLSQARALSDTLVENMPVGLISLDNRLTIASINQATQSILDLGAQSPVGRQAEQVLPKSLLDLIWALDRGNRLVEKEIVLEKAGGDTMLEAAAARLMDRGETRLGSLLLLKDVTEIRNLRTEIIKSQRLASIGRLAAGVAHEIRNPLSSIKGFATCFKQGTLDDAEENEIAGIMIQEVDRLNRVVSQLIELAKPVSVSLRRVNMGTLMQESVKLIENQTAAKNIRIDLRIPDAPPEAEIDPDRIRQVLLNLLLNAIEAMEDTGSLTIQCREDPNGVELIIADTGKGIPEKDLANIFDPYFTTKSTGTGLGLSIVHNIIEAHNAEIKIKSELQKGTSVLIRFPSAAKQERPA